MGTISKILEDLNANINEMPTIGSTFKNSNKVIQVYNSEGKGYPHFHVKKNKKSRIGDACICIKEAKYFEHGFHRGRLEKKDIIDMIDVLHSTQTKTPEPMSMWSYMIMMWNIENNDDLPLDLGMPDYIKMKKSDVVKYLCQEKKIKTI